MLTTSRTTPSGDLRARDAQLTLLRTGALRLTTGGSDDVAISLYGAFAIITGRFVGTVDTPDGTVKVHERYTTAWAKRGGRWTLLAEQGTFIK